MARKNKLGAAARRLAHYLHSSRVKMNSINLTCDQASLFFEKKGTPDRRLDKLV